MGGESLKKLVSLILAILLTTALVGCNTGGVPAVYSPNPNNVNFNDNNLTTNFVKDQNEAAPYDTGSGAYTG